MKINFLPFAIVVSVAAFCVIYFAWIANAGQTSSGLDWDRIVVPNSADGLTHKINEAYGQIEMAFETNKGQTDPSVGFLARGSGYTLFLKPDEAVFALSKPQIDQTSADKMPGHFTRSDAGDPKFTSARSNVPSVLRMKILGANKDAEATQADELAGKANYFVGNDPAGWQTNVSTYGRVRYREVYKGIDLEYYGNQRHLEYDLRVAPGADYRHIAVKFEGADSVKIEPETGDLLIAVDGQTVRQPKPFVYQDLDGQRRQIEAGFDVARDSRIGFNVGEL
jgi:hypothetical protein